MTTKTGTIEPKKQVQKKRHGFFYDLLRRLIKEKPLGVFGLAIVILLLITGIFAKWLAPYGMNDIHLADHLQPPSSTYLLGTDQLGRDLLSRLIYGAQVSMIIGLCAATLNQCIATSLGIFSGYIGGKVDLIIQRFVDVWMSVPSFLILMTVMTIIGHGTMQLILIIGISSGIGGSRVIRSAVIGIKSNMYVQASDAIGCGPFRIMLKHILPNIMALIIIGFTMSVGGAIMQEASLSFLGFGVPPGVPSWGSMLSQEGRQYMEASPNLALYPGFCLTLAVYGVNMLGDSLRDLLDPRLRGGVGRYSLSDKKLKKLKESAAKS